MSDPDMQELIDAAPPGKIMEGTVEVHKSTTGRIMLVAHIGEQEYRKVLPPGALRMLTGAGAGGKLLRRLFGGGEERGPAPVATVPDCCATGACEDPEETP